MISFVCIQVKNVRVRIHVGYRNSKRSAAITCQCVQRSDVSRDFIRPKRIYPVGKSLHFADVTVVITDCVSKHVQVATRNSLMVFSFFCAKKNKRG